MTPSTRLLPLPTAPRLRATLYVAAVLLAACAAPPPPSRAPAPPEAELARAAASEGAHPRAAQLYEDAAQSSGDPRWQLRAANQWLLAGVPERAEPLLQGVNRDTLPRSLQPLHDLAWADLSLQRMDLAAAEAFLAATADPGEPGFRARREALQARYEALSQGPGAVALAEARQSLESMRGAAPVPALELLLQLDGLDTASLQRLEADTVSDPRLAAWAGLAWRARHLAVGALKPPDAYDGWAATHAVPALTEDEFHALMSAYAEAHEPPAAVAILLPGSGPLQAAGELLRDGLLDAFLTRPGDASLRFYPTTAEPASAVSAYYHALEDGADWVVGPLDRESVNAMLPVIDPATPVLLLNGPREAADMPRPADATVFSLTLSPEAEARAVARRALADGHRRALALVPETATGDRLLTPFQAAYEAGGGHLVAVARYAPGGNDHSDLLTQVLDIQASRDRHRALQGTLNLPLEFEPVRRQDLDMIFLVSEPNPGRLMRPQLRFHDAGDIPVYSTARIYSGTSNPGQDVDLDGVRFTVTPLQLEVAAGGAVGPDGGALNALFALGRDAWRLLRWLPLMAIDPELEFHGDAGAWSDQGRLELARVPAWAEFRGGRPRPLKPPAGPVSAPGAGQ